MKNGRSNSTAIPKNGSQFSKTSISVSIHASELLKLFGNDLKDIYWLEKELTNVIPKMIKDATSPELIGALTSHHATTQSHVARVEQVFELMFEKAVDNNSDAAFGLIRDTVEIMNSCEAGAMCDAVIISATKKIQYYELAIYETLLQFAESLGLTEVASLFEATLNEERTSKEKLSLLVTDAIKVQVALKME
jgi:ferritin-like metal-binding protein YciE